jgi:hypothetical protein
LEEFIVEVLRRISAQAENRAYSRQSIGDGGQQVPHPATSADKPKSVI